jgi:hypothetical protein
MLEAWKRLTFRPITPRQAIEGIAVAMVAPGDSQQEAWGVEGWLKEKPCRDGGQKYSAAR